MSGIQICESKNVISESEKNQSRDTSPNSMSLFAMGKLVGTIEKHLFSKLLSVKSAYRITLGFRNFTSYCLF